jgi:3-oxoadipyl-CoA thiolase
MTEAFLVTGVRTPIGRYGGALAQVRPDDLAAHTIQALLERVETLDGGQIDEVILGCTNQAGEDNRNVARMALLLAGMPETVPAVTVNRLCGSGLEAVAQGARLIRTGECELVLAGGVESMSRAPFVLGKSEAPFSRGARLEDTTIGWRFVNGRLAERYGVDSMPETAENVAAEFGVSREDQDAFALRSQERAARAREGGRLAREIEPVPVSRGGSEPMLVAVDEHPRETSLELLGALPTPFRQGGTVTAGNASGINDGAAALLVASERAVERLGVTPLARVAGAASAGVPPRIMGMGPVPAVKKLLGSRRLDLDDIDLVELNEAFAAQVLACLRQLGLPDDAEHVNPNGGAIALGHPLGMSGSRLALTAAIELADRGAQRALCTMCIGVGQGTALLLEAP